MKWRALLLDLDGVLIDSEPAHQASLAAVCVRLGRALSVAELASFKGTTEGETLRRLQVLFPADAAAVERELAARLRGVVDSVAQMVEMRRASAFLKRSRVDGYRLALATSGFRRYVDVVSERFGFTGCFDAVVVGEDVKRGKPDPEPYLLAAARLQCAPGECAVVEDSLNGVRSGKAAGCFVFGLTSSFSADALRAAGADVAVESFDELQAKLDAQV